MSNILVMQIGVGEERVGTPLEGGDVGRECLLCGYDIHM